ncbi:MAG: GNAT family N-acetyltransferase [Parafilimonas sp.]
MKIECYNKVYQQQVIELILNIQQNEFNVPVTINDQPDLLEVENFYFKGNGNFWVATENSTVVGTVALIDMGNNLVCLRKMFVHADYRGKEKGTGQLLLDGVVDWCRQKNITAIYLGTVDKLIAAQKFYLKNNFVEIPKSALPVSFPVMQVDNMFFKLVV